jgi:murein DD-endopeptidase MepM/ murein hydrolase activator NlpD
VPVRRWWSARYRLPWRGGSDVPAWLRRVGQACLRLRGRRVLAGAAVPFLLLLLWPGKGGPWTLGPRHAAAAMHPAAAGDQGGPPAPSETPAAQLDPTQRQRLADQVGGARPDRAPLVGTYTVQPGDTLSSIAAQFGTSVASLEKVNGLNDGSILHPGQQLTVLRTVGWLYTVKAGETLASIAAATGVPLANLAATNDLSQDNGLQAGMQLVIPQEPSVPQPAASVAFRASAAPVAAGSSWGLIWPVHGPVTSPFGFRPDPWTGEGSFFHDGIDIAVPAGTPVAAACSGRVILAGWDGGYGKAVEVACDNGLITMYAHNSVLEVGYGQRVAQGQTISLSGMTGNATGPHVHFGVMRGGAWQNPLRYLP